MQIRQRFIKDWRSTIGYSTFVGGNLLTWSKKQAIVDRSCIEAKYRAMAHEVLWIKTPPKELNFEPKEPMKIHCNNKVAINIAHNPIQHDWTKQVEVDRHFINEKIEIGEISTPFVTAK